MAIATRIDLGWLVRLRWFGYAGAFGVAVAARHWVHLAVDLVELGALVAVGLASNVAAHLWLRRRTEGVAAIAGLLSLDVLLLSLGLAWNGGLLSPLGLAYLGPLVVAAVTLPRWATALLLLETLLGLGLLAAIHPELRADHEHPVAEGREGALAAHGSERPLDPHEHAALHRDGAWLGVWGVGLLVVVLVRRALRDRERQIEALHRDKERAERLAELSTLAASATHALGSPLSTIAVISRELERSLEAEGRLPDLLDDVRAIREEVERCRQVLENMANDARTGKEPETLVALGELCESARQNARAPDLVELRLQDPSSSSLVPRRSLLQVLASLLDNASEAAPGEKIALHACDTGTAWRIEISDRGVPKGGLPNPGETHVSAKPFGMGIGLFLGRAILERLGGTLELERAPSGTSAVLTLPTTRALDGDGAECEVGA